MQDEKPMDMEQLADWFGVSVPTVRNWLRDGVPCLRPSPGVVRFTLAEVVEWSKKHSNYDASERRATTTPMRPSTMADAERRAGGA